MMIYIMFYKKKLTKLKTKPIELYYTQTKPNLSRTQTKLISVDFS